MRSTVIDLDDEQVHALGQMQTFVEGTIALDFAVARCFARIVLRHRLPLLANGLAQSKFSHTIESLRR